VEPGEVNRDRKVRIYAGDVGTSKSWRAELEWKKDLWHMALFQYGNAFFPDGNNATLYLALTTTAVQSDDGVTSIYKLKGGGC